MTDQQQADLRRDEMLAGTQTPLDAPGIDVTEARQNSLWSDAWKALKHNPLFWVGSVLMVLFVTMALFPGIYARGADPRQCSLSNSRQKPSAEHWFGYDQQGCDYLAQVVYGARNSLIIGVLAVIVILVLGVAIGAIAGFYGGFIDTILSRIADIFFAIPLVLAAIVLLRSAFDRIGPVQVAIALAAFGWMLAMRLVRSQVIAVKSSDYVAAARAMGASDVRILVRHILPNAIAPVLVFTTITIGILIAAEATLTFLGVGLQRPAISWGLQIDTGQGLLRTAPHLVLFPSAVLTMTVMAFVMLGDALRDALDPRQRS